MKKFLLSFIIIHFSILFSLSDVQQVWVRTYGTGNTGYFIETDPPGNVYVVGFGIGMDAPYFTDLQKFDNNGTPQWQFSLNRPCFPVGVSWDSLYNEYIAGYENSNWGLRSYTLVKYNSSGSQQWLVSDSISSYNDVMWCAAGDKAGNSVFVEYKSGQVKLLKYNSSGVQQFSQIITDTITVQAVTIDGQGNIILSGWSTINSNPSGVTIKYTSSGARLWKTLFNPSCSSLSAIRLITAQSGNIFVLFVTTFSASSGDYTLIKYNSSGTQQWVSYFDNNNQNDVPNDMFVDSLEITTITGSSGTVRFNSSGVQQWVDNTAGMNGITRDKYGNIYVTGTAGSGSNTDMRTVKLNNNGGNVWSIDYNGTYNVSDGAYAIALDTSLNVYITGFSNNVFIPPYYIFKTNTTIKYAQFVGVQNVSRELPEQFRMFQNYPNPFNPSTKIKIDIPTVGTGCDLSVRLIVYDILGRDIATLVNERLKPGTYEVEWPAPSGDGTNYPSGVYFYKLSATGGAESFTQTERMVLIK